MKIIPLAHFFVMSAIFCPCGPKMGGIEDSTWISPIEARRVAERFTTQAQLVEELGEGQIFKYRFASNGTVSPISALVDRKTGKVRIEVPIQ